MKIVHVIEPFASGVAVFVKSLTETMPEDVHLVVHGERKQVMSAKEVKRLFPRANVRFIRWKSVQRSINPIKDFRALLELYQILKRLKKHNLVDAVHLHSSKGGVLGRIACRVAGIKEVVYTPNGAPFLSSRSTLLNFFYKQLERQAHRWGGQVVCCSASEQLEYQKIGVPASYINNGVSFKSFSSPLAARKKNKKFRVVTTGRIEAQKNPALFNSIASYFEDFEQIEFIWAGDGRDRDLLTSKNVAVTGWVSAEAIKELVGEADIFLSTSVYEGLSFSVLEALALKKPVLLSDCVGNRDIIQNGLNGDVFGNEITAIAKILHYFHNREMLEVMGDYSQNICRSSFDVDLNFKSYKSIYQGFPSLLTPVA